MSAKRNLVQKKKIGQKHFMVKELLTINTSRHQNLLKLKTFGEKDVLGSKIHWGQNISVNILLGCCQFCDVRVFILVKV